MAAPKKPMRPKGRMPQMPNLPKWGGDSFWVNLATSVLVLLLLAGAYSYFTGADGQARKDVALSQIAQDINAGAVKSIEVSGDELKISYADESEKKSKKEPEAALSESLLNYGVTPE